MLKNKTYEYWDIDPTSTGCFGIAEPSTTYHWKYAAIRKFQESSQVPSFLLLKKKNTMFHKNGPIPPRLHPTWRFIPWSLPCSRVAEHRTHAQRLLRRAGPGLGAAGRAGSAAFRRSWSGLHLNVRRAERVRVTLGSPFLYRPCMAICTYIWLIFMVKCR